jgi:Asp-tRNA(Asn)/Glu-tRNA(Gln) amidotransferase B subunit
MIYRNLAHGKNEILATLAIKINRPNGAYETYYNGFVDSPRKAKQWFEKKMNSWIKDELKKFCNQREHALQEVGMLSMNMIARVETVRKTATGGAGHLELCKAIVNHQDDIRMLVPSPNSRQYYWAPVVEEIIHYAYQQNAQAAENKHNYEKQNLHKQ